MIAVVDLEADFGVVVGEVLTSRELLWVSLEHCSISSP